MINRTLSRRLERLEEQTTQLTVRKVWQIIRVNSDDTREPTEISVEWPSNPATGSQGIYPSFGARMNGHMTGLRTRLERLEGSATPSGIQHVITVTYVNSDGTVCGDGYRIEGP